VSRRPGSKAADVIGDSPRKKLGPHLAVWSLTTAIYRHAAYRVIPIVGRNVYIETVLVDDDPKNPYLDVVNIHDA
jgi:hypothetical protein